MVNVEVKKLCEKCNCHNHWTIKEADLRYLELICQECKRPEVFLDRRKNIIFSCYCSECNFFNVYDLVNGLPFKLNQFHCKACGRWDLTLGRTMEVSNNTHDISNYDKTHFTES